MVRKNLNEVIKLSDEQKKQIADEVKAFYLDVRGEEIGIIEQQQIIELFCEHMAPILYNKALDDAMRWMKEQLGNMESDYYLLYKDVRQVTKKQFKISMSRFLYVFSSIKFPFSLVKHNLKDPQFLE